MQYEIAAYEAAMDLLKIAKANTKLGNSFKALQFLALATHLFPYRDDIVNTFKRTLSSYIDETNALISAKNIECGDLKNRVAFISSISPKEASRLRNNESCFIKEDNRLLTLDQIDLTQWIDQSKQLQKSSSTISKAASMHDTPTDDLFLLAQKMQKNAKMDAEEANKVYDLKFPKVEILVNAMKVLGQFSFMANSPKVETINDGDVILTGSYYANKFSSFTYEGLCRTIAPYFSLPPRQSGITYSIGKATCGYTKSYDRNKKNLEKFLIGDWQFENVQLNLMPNTSKYISDDPKGKTALFRFLPRILDMKLSYIYGNGERRDSTFQVQIKDMLDFFGWVHFPELINEDQGILKPELLNNNAHIVFLNGNRFAIPVPDLQKLKGLKAVEIAFDAETTFKRMVKMLDIKLKQ
ncbi:hypothetical protein M900_A0476 [Bacteriovorax sp. Seq25_V]|nr:hypothetical protein M900_A0476 [Bacteriovorax sp. Seq25_V]